MVEPSVFEENNLEESEREESHLTVEEETLGLVGETLSVVTEPPGTIPLSDWIEQRFTVEGECDGFRLDQFLKKKIRRLSRNRIQRVIRGECFVEGVRAKPSQRVHFGQTVMFKRPPPPEPEVPRNISVLYEDPWFYVIEKPAGLPIHPTARYHHSTLTSVLRERFPEEPLQVAHRLDRETSGLMIVARHKEAASSLKQAFARRQIQKRYLAIVHGSPKEEAFFSEEPLGPTPERVRVKMGLRSLAEGGLPAKTEFRVVSRYANYTLVECTPLTGRQHQIRVHLYALDHPIVGDKLYPDEQIFIDWSEQGFDAVRDRLPLERHALHAAGLGFLHPQTQTWVEVLSPLPDDLKVFLETVESAPR